MEYREFGAFTVYAHSWSSGSKAFAELLVQAAETGNVVTRQPIAFAPAWRLSAADAAVTDALKRITGVSEDGTLEFS